MHVEDNLATTARRGAGGLVRSVVAIAMIVSASACGGGSSGSDAVQKCKDLSQLKCERVVECGGMPSVPTCLADIQKSEYCDHAVAVTSSYDACLQDLRAISCTELLASGAWNLPLSCMGVILVQ
jgi:hypothetical protein